MDAIDLDLQKLFEDPSYGARLCAINRGDLAETMQRHASLYFYANSLYETARLQESLAKDALEKAEADVFNMIQQKESLAIGRTERRVDADPVVVRAKAELRKKSERAGQLKALVASLEHRRDMLVQLSSREKAELRNY